MEQPTVSWFSRVQAWLNGTNTKRTTDTSTTEQGITVFPLEALTAALPGFEDSILDDVRFSLTNKYVVSYT